MLLYGTVLCFCNRKCKHIHLCLTGYQVAKMNGCQHNYVVGSGTINLDKQENYRCLRECTHPHLRISEFIKQKSEKWIELRKKAKVTGKSATS